MKKSNVTGWKEVFSFTLVQTLKSKAFIISWIILVTLVLVSMPLISKFTAGATGQPNESCPVRKVYVNNETTLPDIDFSGVTEDEKLSNIVFETMQEEYDAVAERIDKTELNSVILTVKEEQGVYSLTFVMTNNGPVTENNIQPLEKAVVNQFKAFRINALGITDEQVKILNSKVKAKVSLADVNGEPIVREDTSITFSEYWFIYAILFVVLMFNVMASSQIANSVVTEKSTRVVEYLLVSVKPLALIVGKVIAMLLAVMLQMVSIVVMLFVSNKISAGLLGDTTGGLLSKYLTEDIFQNLNVVNIIICFIFILMGMVFYGILAGIAGATVSKVEELGEGMTLFSVINLAGAYVGMAAASILMGPGVNGFVIFSFLFPLSSPFILPGAILAGKVSLPVMAGAAVMQVVFIILLFRFAAKVYETLILHSGNKVKVKELIRISKTV